MLSHREVGGCGMNACASIPGVNGNTSVKSLKGMQGRVDVGMVFPLTPLWGLRVMTGARFLIPVCVLFQLYSVEVVKSPV